MPQTTQTAPSPQAAKPPKPKPPEPPPEFQEGDIATMDATALIRILTDASSSEFQKAKACQRVGELGPREAVPALSALLSHEHLNTYARYGLEPIADPSADDALRRRLVEAQREFADRCNQLDREAQGCEGRPGTCEDDI